MFTQEHQPNTLSANLSQDLNQNKTHLQRPTVFIFHVCNLLWLKAVYWKIPTHLTDSQCWSWRENFWTKGRATMIMTTWSCRHTPGHLFSHADNCFLFKKNAGLSTQCLTLLVDWTVDIIVDRTSSSWVIEEFAWRDRGRTRKTEFIERERK